MYEISWPGAVRSEQAYVSAQQPASAQDAWLPPADAHPGRSFGAVESAAEGSPASGCL